MSKVYVGWYGKVLEGELLDGELMGMKQVRIPLDGRHPVALFTPGHVYNTEAEASECGLVQTEPVEQTVPKEVCQHIEGARFNDIMPAYDRLGIEAFKEAYWDRERNHLRIDKLDEFYKLWRMAMTPFGFVETKARYIVGVDPVDPAGDVSVVLPLKPPPPPVHHKICPKDTIRKNIVELSLFE